MAEHGLSSKVIGVAFDGTGYGTDGNLWGGEFLIADCEGFERVGQFAYTALPGGESAIREPWKTAVSHISEAGKDHVSELLEDIGFTGRYGKSQLEQVMRVSRSREFSPLSSGAGRLFDAVSAMIGACDRNTFEGEAAMALESLLLEGVDGQYVIELKQENGYTIVDFSGAIHGLIRDITGGISRELMSTKFHNTIVTAIRTVVRRINEYSGITDVALSGGTFQNRYLLKRAAAVLAGDGMNVFVNQKAPCNDGGISLGQAYLVRERLKNQCGMRNAECGRA